MKYKLTFFLLIPFLTACASSRLTQISDSEIQPMEYVYENLDGNRTEIFKRARDFFAESFGDSTSVVRVSDVEQGKYIGKGVVSWVLSTGMVSVPCASNYTLKFLSKDGRAKLEITLNKGIVAGHSCRWDKPTVDGYSEVTAEFDRISSQLKKYLLANNEYNF